MSKKKHNPQKLILVDCDGVLCNWEYAFAIWMEQHGFEKVAGGEFIYDIGGRYAIGREQGKKLIKMFNESAAIGFLPPLRDAMYYVKRLHEEHGYVFHCITSLSTDINAQRLREMNLKKLFGDTAGATEIGKFGSLALGSPTTTLDPAQMQSLAPWSGGWFAAVLGGNSPAIEDMNAFSYVMAYHGLYGSK